MALALILVSSSLQLMGQGNEFVITGRFRVDGGSNNDAKIVVEKNGSKVKTLDGSSRFEVGLDYQAVYVVSFVKEGYVTKKLRFDTHVPDSRIEYGFEPFDFTIEIFEQYDDVNMVVFNQPVGKISYSELIDEFDYDTDYTKSIQAQIDLAMDEVEEKKEEKAQEEAAQQKAEEKLNKEVSNLTSGGDKSASSGNYEEALKSYEEAAQLKDSPELQKKIEETKQKIAEKAKEQEKQDEFDKLMADADAAMAGGDLEGAKKLYEQANGVMEGNPRVKGQLDKVNKELEAQAQQEEEFQNLLKAAQDAAKQENWTEAQQKAEEALKIKPDPALDKIKADAIAAQEEAAAAAQADAELQGQYDALLAEADKASSDKNFKEAIAKLEEASKLKDTPEIQQKLTAAKDALEAEEKAAEEAAANQAKGEQLLQEASTALENGDLAGARQKATEASAILGEDGLKDLLKEIDAAEKNQAAQAEEQAALQKQYDDLIATGNEKLAAGELEEAKNDFNKASELKPDGQEAATGLENVNARISEQAAAEAAQAEEEAKKKEDFEALLAKADNALANGDLDGAKESYIAAGELFEDKRVDKGLKDVDDALAAQVSEAEAAAQKQVKYDQLIQAGNEQLAAGELDKAKDSYTEAQQLIPEGEEAAQGLKDIEAKRQEQEASQAAAAEVEAKKKEEFEALLSEADDALANGDLEGARESYTAAGELFEDKRVDKGLKAIEDAMAANASAEEAAAQKQTRYDQLVQTGNDQLAANELEGARDAFLEAQSLFPDGEEASKGLEDVNAKLAELESNQAAAAEAEAEKKEQFEALLTKADDALANGDLEGARESYMAAGEMFEDKRVEKGLKAVEDALSEQSAAANQEAEQKAKYDNLMSEGQQAMDAGNLEEAKNKYQDAQAISDGPEVQAKLDEVSALIEEQAAAKAQQAEQAEVQAKFDKLEASGDKAFGKEDWDNAKSDYTAALDLKEDEAVRKKLEDTEAKLAEMLASEAAANEAEQTAAEQERIQKEFDDKIKEADAAFDKSDWPAAEAGYREALAIKEDDYPNQQLQKINEQRAQASEADRAAQEARFNDLITQADKAFDDNKLVHAREAYSEALQIKEDDHAQSRLSEIMELEEAERMKNEQEAAARDQAERFKSLISDGDKLFQANKLNEAVDKYKEALAVQDDDGVRKKIAQVEAIIKQRAEEKERAATAAQTITDERGSANQEVSQVIMEESSKQNPSTAETQSPEVAVNDARVRMARAEMGSSSQQPGSKLAGGTVVLSDTKRGEAALETTSAKMSEEDKFDGMMKRAEIQQTEFAESEAQKKLKEKYTERKTVETEKVGNSTITYVYINHGDFVTVYKKVEHNWGGVFYFIDDRSTNARFWMHETK